MTMTTAPTDSTGVVPVNGGGSAPRSRWWYTDRAALNGLPFVFRLLGMYYRRRADPATGQARYGSYWHYRAARLIQRLRAADTARVRLGDVLVEIDLLDRRCTWVMDELLQPAPEGQAVRSLLRKGDTFLDVGANHGSYSLIAAPVVGAEGVVLAFEPQPRLAMLLRRSFQANGFRHAEVLEVACSDSDGQATFFVSHTASGTGGLYEGFSGGAKRKRFNVALCRLDDRLAGRALPGRVLLKLDVEGSELSVIRGAASFLRERRPLIVLELNPSSAKAAGYDVRDLLRTLGEIGYDRIAEPAEFPRARLLADADHVRQRNVFIIPPPSTLAGHWDL
jgi:FkbM family methyltransferase